jgi:protein O-GlcNAc transferase
MGEAARRKLHTRGGDDTLPESPSTLAARARVAVRRGDLDAALPLFAASLARGNTSPDVFSDLGAVLAMRGQLLPAIVQFEIALSIDSAHAGARGNLLNALQAVAGAAFQEGRWADAAGNFARMCVLAPDSAACHMDAASALRKLKEEQRALPYLRRARALAPDDPKVCFALGSLLLDLNQREAEGELRRALELDPLYVDALVNLALVEYRLGRLSDAVTRFGRALELQPAHGEAHANLAAVLRDQGETAGSLEHYRRAMELKPDLAVVGSGYLLIRQADPAAEPAQLLTEHRAWNDRFAASLDPGRRAFAARDRDPERRLRVGYVSADLRSHSVASFIEPVIAAHDRARVQVFCYSDSIPDAVTARIRATSDVWRETGELTDANLAAQIEADAIDVLVDLAGHTAGNRLLCFARRPAPVQVTYCGYPGTTGLAAMDWRLTDAIADPAGPADGHASERLYRLTNGFLCFRPAVDAPEVGPSPFRARGHVTFGSFNNLAKLNDGVLSLWAQILHAVPDSRLFLKAKGLTDPGPAARLRACLEACHVDPARVEIAPYAATPIEHLAAYRGVDIALDPFPYNGTTTTCESFWMGVPVVTLLGGGHAGRVGASLLARVGLHHLVADSPQHYLTIASSLARDWDALEALRGGLRPLVAASALASSPIITGDLEVAFRDMWRDWCSGGAR